MLVTTTDAFTLDDLTTGEKTAIIIHAGADNFAKSRRSATTEQRSRSRPDADEYG